MAMLVFAASLLGLVALTSANADNVAFSFESLMELGTHRHLESLMSNMTPQMALSSPPSMPADLQAFVSERLSGAPAGMTQSHIFLQSHTLRSKATKSQLSTSMRDADSARKALNKLATDAMGKLDFQRAECQNLQSKQQQLLGETTQDIVSFNAQGTHARAQLMATQTAMKRLQDMIPKLNQELREHDARCKESHTTLKAQIVLVQKDSATLKEVSGMSGCASFLQRDVIYCNSNHTAKGKGFAAFKHPELRRKAEQLKTKTAREGMKMALLEVATSRHHRHRHRHRRHAHRHRRERRHRHEHRRHRRHRHGHHQVTLIAEESRAHLQSATHADATRDVHQGPYDKAATARCKLRKNPDCNTVSDKLLLMQANNFDELESREAELASTDEDCKAAKKNLQDQIKSTQQRLQEQQEMLAEATTGMITAAEQSRVKGIQLDSLEAQHKQMDEYCQDSVRSSALELCKIRSIRQELYKIEKKRPFIQDCEVSAWTPSECSKSCGGGVQNLVRQIVVPAALGASCPPLTMQRSCNSQPCPVDCRIGEWSGWTSCSAKCGGGIKQRIRQLKQRAKHGGKVCGAESESAGCGMGACDKDCDLAAWSPWSTCSRACGGGFQERVRKDVSPAIGLGKCPAEDSEYRLQYIRCSNDKCKPKTAPLLKCAAKVDVIILLDGSGSLGQKGFDAMKKAGADVIRAMDPNANNGNGAQVAVMMYSGPKNMDAYKKCTGAVASSKEIDMAKDCNMIWVSHLTTSNTQIATGVESLIWQKGSTMISQALGSAEAELVYGRPDAKQVVIAFADRLPMMPKRTGEAAASLRKKARLIWAAATGPTEINKFASWASRPAADNLIYVNTVEDFKKPEVLNKIIAAACPKVE